ncbi:MAG: DNA methyltransferase [Verrucomicrobiota bacterium]
MSLNIITTRDRLQKFEFARLFIDELGWSNPKARNPVKAQVKEAAYTRTPIAQLSGVVAFEVTTGDGIPDAKVRAAIQKHVAEEHVENLIIFLDAARTQSLWYWVKRESGKAHARDHLYVKGQPGDLFLSKLAAMVVDISELDADGNIPVTEVAGRLKAALDVERVTKKFFGEFDTQRLAFVEHIHGISDDHQRRWYASVLMNRLMFIWFLQRKGFLDGADRDYLTGKLAASKKRGADKFYSVFLKSLFFEGFAKPEPARSPDTRALLGKIRYLNGGLFLPHRVELNHGFPNKPQIKIPDVAFENIFALFQRYSWNLNDTPGGDDQEINPDVLGYIFEKYINQKEFGAYYTRPEMTGYLCERTIYKLILDRVNKALDRRYATISDLLLNLDANLCRVLLFEVLPSLRLLDPACGSAAFLVAAMKVLIASYSAAIGKIQFLNDTELAKWHQQTQAEHPSVLYFIKKQIITNNLFGVDIMEEATEIARLRLFLALVASAQTEEQLEPLPNIDFNILAGNSLIGLLREHCGYLESETHFTQLFKPLN